MPKPTFGPRAPDDHRMYLYFDWSAQGQLRWYVRVNRTGKKIRIRGDYGTIEFDKAYDAAVIELGGVKRLRRIKPDSKPSDPRRYLHADRSRHGQLRHYVQIHNRLPKIRIRAEFGTREFDQLVKRAIESQIALYGEGTDHVNAKKKPHPPRVAFDDDTPAKQGSLRWYWTNYNKSDHWLGNITLGIDGLSPSTRHQRTLLVERLLHADGEKPYSALTRAVIIGEMNARTPTQAGNLLSAIRGVIKWMIAEEHLAPEDDPTTGIKSGKSRASRLSGGWVPWEEEDMARYIARWPLGTEARLMFEVLRCTHLRVGDAHRLGPSHVRNGMLRITTEKSGFSTPVEMPVHPDLIKAINATNIGQDVFTGKLVKGQIVPMCKEAWAAKFKKYAVLAGVNLPKKSCHGVRKARAEDAAYAGMTESQMMACFGWKDPKMAAHYIAKANRALLGASGMAKMFQRDQTAKPARPERKPITSQP